MTKQQFAALFGFLLTASAAAANPGTLAPNAVQTETPSPKIDTEKPVEPQSVTPTEVQQQVENTAQELTSVTVGDLKKDPQLAEKALNLALIRQNWQAVKEILPIYQSFPSADNVLVTYAQGALYREQGDYKQAIDLYRKLIAENPEMLRVRMDLAILLFADRQDTAAKDQFIKLRSDPSSDELTNKVIDQYLERINQRSEWSFNGNLSYIRDDNVNNASSSKVIVVNGLEFEKEKDFLPQKAHGFDFSLGASKDFNVSGSHYVSFDASSYGKIYWDNHPYDDFNIRLSTGYQYKDAQSSFGSAPFVKFRYAGGEPYSKTFGLTLNGNHWLNPNWQLSSYNELAWEKSDLDENKDKPKERQLYTSLNVLWAPKSTQYFVLGGNVFDVKTGSKSTSYTRAGVSAIWNQDWPLGISSKINFGLGRKVYKGQHYLGLKRRDRDYSAGLTLWNRDWHLWGITPKLAFRYNDVRSNIPDLYSYDKGTVFLQFDKTF